MTPAIAQPVLVYTRIAHNRRKTWLLVAFAIASIIPFVLAISFGVSAFVMSEIGGRAHAYRVQEIRMHKHFADESRDWEDSTFSAENRAQEMELRREDERALAADRDTHLKLMIIVSAALLAVLGLLFWGIASSPTSKVLSLTGARPAAAPEAECKRLLENLSIGAGLPTPQLYVIESSSPNAFAAGTDPRYSVVVVTRGLLVLMDRRELEGVLAHELSHIANQDTRLNTMVASIALFLRLPYLLRKRQRRSGSGNNPLYRRFQMYRLALSPLYLYVFFIAPLMASVIRAAISRSREYLADADAALLTRYPEGLMRALAKIRGAGSALAAANPVVSHFYFGDPAPSSFNFGMFAGNLLATHPPIDQRILRLAEYHGGVPPAVIEGAIRAGQQFTKDRPAITENDFAPVSASDELSVLTVGNPMGRVCRVVGLSKPVPLYDRPDPRSPILRRVADGDLLVVFDDPGKYRQVITSDQTFGYIPYSVKLQKTNLFPHELYGMQAQPAPVIEPAPVAAPALAPVVAPSATVPEPIKGGGLTSKQLAIAAMVFVGVFAAMVLTLMQFGGK
jgi:heat shock protein HtpX